MAAQLGQRQLSQVDAAHPESAALRIVEPSKQTGDRRFATSGAAEDTDCGAGLDVQADLGQHRVVVAVAEGYPVELHG